MNRGYFGVVAYHSKNSLNVGTLWRTADILGAAFIGTIGPRYQRQPSDTRKTWKHTPLFSFKDFAALKNHVPQDCEIVAVELEDAATDLCRFKHPERAIYLLGAEDYGIPKDILSQCHHTVRLLGEQSMNMGVCGSIVLYHRVGLR